MSICQPSWKIWKDETCLKVELVLVTLMSSLDQVVWMDTSPHRSNKTIGGISHMFTAVINYSSEGT